MVLPSAAYPFVGVSATGIYSPRELADCNGAFVADGRPGFAPFPPDGGLNAFNATFSLQHQTYLNDQCLFARHGRANAFADGNHRRR
jgi:hypothetical protein